MYGLAWHGGKSSGWMNARVLADSLDCPVCYQPLNTVIYECSYGHFLCGSCYKKMLDKQCPLSLCSNNATTEPSMTRSDAMEHVVRSILFSCSYAKYGCRGELSYFSKGPHERACWKAPCFCPESGCSFAGRVSSLLDHLTTQHKCPSTVLPDSDKVSLSLQPGLHVLRRMSSHFFLVSMASEPFGYAISIVCVQPHTMEPEFTCCMNYDCSMTGYSESSTCTIRKSSLSDGLPKGYDLILPKGKIPDDRNGIKLRMAIEGQELLSYSSDND